MEKGVILTFSLPSGSMTFVIHGGCSSVVEHQIVDLVVAGSRPVTHPKKKTRQLPLEGLFCCSILQNPR